MQYQLYEWEYLPVIVLKHSQMEIMDILQSMWFILYVVTKDSYQDDIIIIIIIIIIINQNSFLHLPIQIMQTM